MKLKVKKLILIISISILICFVIIPYVKVEILTAMHWEEFQDLYKQTNMIDNIKYLKVFSYNSKEAKIYYVGNDCTDMITFIHDTSEQWRMYRWDTVWSRTGSADDFSWPYYKP